MKPDVPAASYMPLQHVAKVLGVGMHKVCALIKVNLYDQLLPKKPSAILTRSQLKKKIFNKNKRKKLHQGMIDHVRKPEVVKAWAGLTLPERAVMLHR